MGTDLYSISDVARSFSLTVPTLRYYEEQGLIHSTSRIGRVRHFDREQLVRLAYALLLHDQAGMSIEETRAIMDSGASTERHRLIDEQLTAISDRIARLNDARATLEHLLVCPSDDPQNCPRTGKQLRQRVAEALDHSVEHGDRE